MPTSPAQRLAGARCLVTGGAGFIGSNLSRALLSLGAEVQVIDDLSSGSLDNLPESRSLSVVEGDLRDHPDLRALVESTDYVFHLAAQVGNVKSIVDPEGDASSNIMGSIRLFNACRSTRVRRIVYSSSSAIFGEASTLPISEDHPTRPASFYALSKLAGERYALLANELLEVPTVCLRYFNVFGLPMEENEYTGVISIFFNRLAAGETLTIYGDGEQFRDFVYVRDVVQANLLASVVGRLGGVYNIGTGERTTVRRLAETMMEVTGRRVEVRHAPPRAGEVARSVADIGLARRELGYSPQYDLASGLQAIWSALVEDESGGG